MIEGLFTTGGGGGEGKKKPALAAAAEAVPAPPAKTDSADKPLSLLARTAPLCGTTFRQIDAAAAATDTQAPEPPCN